jgi:hypothetical protein
MPEFHIGDKVCVTMAGSFISGTITATAGGGESSGPAMYQLDNGPWWPEVRLDYDITTEQKQLVMEGERITWELFAAAADADKFWQKAKAQQLPPALLASYRRKIKSIIEHFNAQT